MIKRFKADGREFEFDTDRLLNVECIAIEKATRLTVDQWQAGLNSGSAVAITALVWVLRKRQEPTLRYEDVAFPMSSFEPLPEPEADEDLEDETGGEVGPTVPAPAAEPVVPAGRRRKPTRTT